MPLGDLAHTGKEAKFQARNIARTTEYSTKFLVKAQVQVAQRALGHFIENGFKGGVHIAETPEEVEHLAN